MFSEGLLGLVCAEAHIHQICHVLVVVRLVQLVLHQGLVLLRGHPARGLGGAAVVLALALVRGRLVRGLGGAAVVIVLALGRRRVVLLMHTLGIVAHGRQGRRGGHGRLRGQEPHRDLLGPRALGPHAPGAGALGPGALGVLLLRHGVQAADGVRAAQHDQLPILIVTRGRRQVPGDRTDETPAVGVIVLEQGLGAVVVAVGVLVRALGAGPHHEEGYAQEAAAAADRDQDDQDGREEGPPAGGRRGLLVAGVPLDTGDLHRHAGCLESACQILLDLFKVDVVGVARGLCPEGDGDLHELQPAQRGRRSREEPAVRARGMSVAEPGSTKAELLLHDAHDQIRVVFDEGPWIAIEIIWDFDLDLHFPKYFFVRLAVLPAFFQLAVATVLAYEVVGWNMLRCWCLWYIRCRQGNCCPIRNVWNKSCC
mmetsp:Transcript_39152/g.110674  ORF Transcript_39152/g.110674 Transcript_39152/m.110674 type:complete len:425 (-) Transcript_39152:1076-2350(-)